MDKIIIRDLHVRCILGIYPRERMQEQEIVINVELLTDTRRAAQSDDIADCVDYEKVSNAIRDHARAAKRQTVEALAQDVADLCLRAASVEQAIIRIEKTEAIGFTASVGIEITRSKEN